jgi:hypothetical protein
MSNLGIHVLFRYSKKTGEIDTTMTGMGSAVMQMWALQNTTKTKGCMIFERETGNLVFATYGTADGFPKVRKGKQCEGKTCEDMGIPFSALQEITDDRFDA